VFTTVNWQYTRLIIDPARDVHIIGKAADDQFSRAIQLSALLLSTSPSDDEYEKILDLINNTLRICNDSLDLLKTIPSPPTPNFSA
jgi:hypothetical protein